MKVLCEINNIFDLPEVGMIERARKYVRLSDGQLNLQKAEEYLVLGIAFRDNSPWCFLCVDEDDEYPTAYPIELFRVVDDRMSSYWRLSYLEGSNGVAESSLLFVDWAKDPLFHEKLLNDDPKTIEVFRKYRELMSCEYM